MLDIVVDRRDLKATLSRSLRFMRAARTTVTEFEPVPVLAATTPDA
jgi:hypothetical protein